MTARCLALWVLLNPALPLAAQDFCEAVNEVTLVSPTVVGDGTPGSVTTTDLQNALDGGGHIFIDQGAAPTTIMVSQTLIASSETVLDGGGLVTLSGNNTTQIMRLFNPDPAPDAPLFTITLQNISFEAGTAANSTPSGRGGAIYKEHDFEFPHKVSLRLVNCSFSNNNAPLDGTTQDDGGGAFYAELMNRIDIGNCTFDNNSGSNGGALYSLGSLRLNVVDSVFSNNSAIGTGGNPGNGGNAGAFGVDGGDRLVDICRTQFTGNQSNAFGGAFFSVMYDQTSRSRFQDVTFDGNAQVTLDSEHTGAAYIQDGPWALDRVSFINNEARGFGALFVAGNAPGTITNGTFSNNTARTGLGAAMALTTSAPISIVNTTVANNVSTEAFAAGIAIGSPNQLTLTNTLFANNSGGNIFVDWAMNNPAQFSGGGNMQWPQIRPANGGFETPVTGDVEFADPVLPASAADNGGLVPTLAIDADSPARDAGVSGGGIPAADARGQTRIGAVDIGSFELDPFETIFRNGFENPP